MKLQDRNSKVTIAWLRGYTLTEVAQVFNISYQRVRQICSKRIREVDYELWLSCDESRRLREHKYRLIEKIRIDDEMRAMIERGEQ